MLIVDIIIKIFIVAFVVFGIRFFVIFLNLYFYYLDLSDKERTINVGNEGRVCGKTYFGFWEYFYSKDVDNHTDYNKKRIFRTFVSCLFCMLAIVVAFFLSVVVSGGGR